MEIIIVYERQNMMMLYNKNCVCCVRVNIIIIAIRSIKLGWMCVCGIWYGIGETKKNCIIDECE